MRRIDFIPGIVRAAGLRSVALVLMIAYTMTVPLSTPVMAGDKADKEALIDCVKKVFDSLEPDDQKNEVYPGNKLVWYVRGKKYTNVKIEFVKKNNFCDGTSPFPATSFSHDVKKEYGFEKIDSDKVKNESAEKCYTYKITCTPPTGEPFVVDPIIDVPKP